MSKSQRPIFETPQCANELATIEPIAPKPTKATLLELSLFEKRPLPKNIPWVIIWEPSLCRG